VMIPRRNYKDLADVPRNVQRDLQSSNWLWIAMEEILARGVDSRQPALRQDPIQRRPTRRSR